MTKRLDQTITYWGAPNNDGLGDFSYDAPVQINGWWQDKTELLLDGQGQQVLSVAQVAVDQDVDVGGFLYLGTSAESDPNDQEDAYRIIAFESAKSLIRNRTFRMAKVGR